MPDQKLSDFIFSLEYYQAQVIDTQRVRSLDSCACACTNIFIDHAQLSHFPALRVCTRVLLARRISVQDNSGRNK